MVELLLVLVLGVAATRAGVIHLYHSSYCLYRSRGGRAPTGAGSGGGRHQGQGHPPLSSILLPVQEPGMVELLLVLVAATMAGVIHLYHSSYCLYRSRGW
jgi:hypothetical protein